MTNEVFSNVLFSRVQFIVDMGVRYIATKHINIMI